MKAAERKYPKISIITPSYNQSEFLEECILSVVSQNYPNIEYIVIDGGSTDNSKQILERYDSQISYWVSEPDNGTYDALNKALQIFSGQYWCVVNSDDALKPGSLQILADFAEKNNYPDWITADVEYIDENSRRLGKSDTRFPPQVAGYYFLNGCWIPHPVTFLSRSLFVSVGLFERSDIMDFAYWIEAEKKGYLPVIIKEELGKFRYHTNSKSMKFVSLQKQVASMLTEKYSSLAQTEVKDEYYSLIQDYHFYVFQMAAKQKIFEKRYISAIADILKFLVTHPRHLGKRWPYGMAKLFFKGVSQKDFSPDLMVNEN